MKFPPNDTSKDGEQQQHQQCCRVGLVYDERMCKHATPKGEPHPENPDRIRAIWNKLLSAGIPQRCVVFKAKEVEDKYIATVHTTSHINLIKTISSKKTVSQRNKVTAKYNSVYFNEGSSESAYLAAGSVLEVAEKFAKGELNSAFAIVRPPGHHAEKSEPMGFCLYNNVAIAASFLLDQKKLGIQKILIVDWDVHHGNATQKMFWKDSRVLSFSVHRHENGNFYPGGDDGSHTMLGEGPGLGYNINVPWENAHCDEADYIAVWDHILIPVAKEFNADIILISAGFDAAINDPLGGCCVTPHGFSILLKKLMEFSNGKIVMALEGGYNLDSLANSVLACMEVLLEDASIDDESYEVYPFESTWRVIKDVREKLSTFWPILAKKLPKTLTDRLKPLTEIAPDALSKRRKRQNSPVRNSLSSKAKRQKAFDTDDSENVEDPQTRKVLKKMSNAQLADKLDDDCVSVMTEAARQLCRKEEQAKVKTANNHMASEIAARDKTLTIKEKEIEVLTQQLASLEAKGKENVARMTEALEKSVKQSIDIQDGEKRIQRLLNSEKELKDKMMTSNNHMASEITARDETLTIKEKEIEVLTQQLANLEAKGKETQARMIEALEKSVKQSIAIQDGEKRIHRLLNSEKELKDKMMTSNHHMASEIAARDETLTIKEKDIQVLTQQLASLEAKGKETAARMTEALAKSVKQSIAIQDGEKRIQRLLNSEKELKDKVMTSNNHMASEIAARDETLTIKEKDIRVLTQQLASLEAKGKETAARMTEALAKSVKQSIAIQDGEKRIQRLLNSEKELKDKMMTSNNHMASEIAARDETLTIKEKDIQVLTQQLASLEAKGKETAARMTEALEKSVKQSISIQDGEKRIQRLVNSEKELKDKMMTSNNHMASEITARDKTLTIKEKEIEVLKQQLARLEAKGKENVARMTEALEKSVKQSIAIQDGEKRIQRLLNSEKELKDKVMTSNNHMASEIAARDETLAIKEKDIQVLTQQLASLEAKDKETADRMTEAFAKSVKQSIAIQDGEKRIQRLLNSEKELKDKVMTSNNHMASEIAARDETLTIKEKDIQVLTQQLASLEAKGKETAARMTEALEKSVKQSIAIQDGEKRIQRLLNSEKELKDKVMTSNNHMASEIAARDETLTIKEKDIQVLTQQLASLEAKGKETAARMTEALEKSIKQSIAIQDGEKRIQRLLNSEKELKDKMMTSNNHMAFEIAARDETLTIKEKEIQVLKQQLASLEAKEKDTQARMAEALEKTVNAVHDRHLLLTEYIPEIVFRLLHSDELVFRTVNFVHLGIKNGYQKALKRIQEKMVSHVTLEEMPGYDDTVTEKYYQAAKEYRTNREFAYIQEIAANAHKPLKDIMEITPKKEDKKMFELYVEVVKFDCPNNRDLFCKDPRSLQKKLPIVTKN